MMMGFELILLVLLIGGVAYALGWRPQINPGPPGQSQQNPLDILKSRLARGEISREEYEQMRLALER